MDAFALIDFVNLMAYDGDGPNHSSYAYAQASIAYWQGRGLLVEKTVPGVPFYPRPNLEPYRALVASDPAAADELEHLGAMVNYSGQPAMRHKTELALDRAAGVMMWVLEHDSGDHTSLLNAINETVRARD